MSGPNNFKFVHTGAMPDFKREVWVVSADEDQGAKLRGVIHVQNQIRDTFVCHGSNDRDLIGNRRQFATLESAIPAMCGVEAALGSSLTQLESKRMFSRSANSKDEARTASRPRGLLYADFPKTNVIGVL